jgi:hypothetical protein
MSHVKNINMSFSEEPASGWGAYIPTMVSRMWDPERNFAYATNPEPGKSLAALSTDNRHLYVITETGKFLIFSMRESGGECTGPTDTFTIKHPAEQNLFGQ